MKYIYIYFFYLVLRKSHVLQMKDMHSGSLLSSLFNCVELYDAIDFHPVIGTVAPFYLLLFVN